MLEAQSLNWGRGACCIASWVGQSVPALVRDWDGTRERPADQTRAAKQEQTRAGIVIDVVIAVSGEDLLLL